MVGRVQSVHHGQWLAFWPPSAEDAGADGLAPHGRVVDFPSNADSRLDSMSEVFIKDGIRRHGARRSPSRYANNSELDKLRAQYREA